MSNRRILSLVAAIATLAAIAMSTVVVPRSSVDAEHVAGATYTGTTAGGGQVSFTLSPDGSTIIALSAANLPGYVYGIGGGCVLFEGNQLQPILNPYTSPGIPIENHSFDRDSTTPDGFYMHFKGSFSGGGMASGIITLRTSGPVWCEIGDTAWTARAASVTPSATPTPGPAGIVDVVAGLNIVLYNGSARPVEQALSNCLASVDAIFFWNTSAQAYGWWFKGAPPDVNTLAAVIPGQILWVSANANCSWQQS